MNENETAAFQELTAGLANLTATVTWLTQAVHKLNDNIGILDRRLNTVENHLGGSRQVSALKSGGPGA